DDYELSVLPVFADVARSWSEGHWPILSPYSWVCGNLGGEFQYGTFSVFINAAIILIWKFPLTFPQQAAALSITHLFFLAIGAFLLVRDRRFSISLSIFVALVASLNGWIICWGATDWFGALGAFTWLPWAWWGAARALDPQRSKWRFLWPAPFVYLLITGGFPYTVLMLASVVAWLALRAVFEIGTTDTASPARISPGALARLTRTWPLLAGVTIGFGLAAPAWLALLPTAGVFRWSFRWLPLLHLVLALCAVEAFASFSQKQRRFGALLMLLLIVMLIIGALVLRTGGEHLFPLAWIFLGLALGWFVIESLQLSFLRAWAPAAVVFATLLATYLCTSPNSDIPKYNLAQSLLEPQPLDPQRLYLSVYPPPENFYRVEAKPAPVGQVVRPGSTSMWAGLRFVNGYSPIRPAGVAREFASAIHGEVDPDLAK